VASRTIELVGLGGSIKCVFGATDAPSASDDETRGFSVGSMWKAVGGALYVCDDPSEGAAAWTGAPDDPSPLDFGTLLVDFDAANAVVSGGLVASAPAGLGTYPFAAAFAAPARPVLIEADPDFNGMPSLEFGEAQPLITTSPVVVDGSVITVVVVCRLGADTNARVIMETSPTDNSNPLSFVMYHDGDTMITHRSGANGNVCARERTIPDYDATIHYGMAVDFSVAGTGGVTHYQDGALVATTESFDGGATAGSPAGEYVWYFGARSDGAPFVSGRIARVLGYAGAVDHAGLYEYLAGIYGA
jgi:hypothetical protein